MWTQTNYEAAPAAVHEGGQARWERHGQHALLLALRDSIIEYKPREKESELWPLYKEWEIAANAKKMIYFAKYFVGK